MATKKSKPKSRANAKAKAKTKPASAKTKQPREALRKLFLAGLGLADETNTRLHQAFNSLVKKGQTKQPQVKKAVDDIRRKAIASKKQMEKKFSAYVNQSELLKSKELKEVRETWEKKFSGYVSQSKLLKSKEFQQLRKNWEKKLSEFKKQSEVLKSKEFQAFRKKLETWEAKAREWEAKAKEAAKRAVATPVDGNEEKKWTPSAPQPVATRQVEKEETPVASSEVTPSAPGVPLSSSVSEETTTQE